jgi:hypothetical protein
MTASGTVNWRGRVDW